MFDAAPMSRRVSGCDGAGGGTPALLPLSVRGVRLELGGQVVLRNVSFDLAPGGCTVIMGPNGAGKSQLLRLLHGLEAPTSGTIDWNGRTPPEALPRHALMFQKPVLLRRSVAANLDFVLRSRRQARWRTEALLRHVGLAAKARHPARRLSGGEAQRLALARSLATDPEVLFLDEPTASLDPASTQAIEGIVADACAQGVRVVLVTHDLGQAQRLADDVVFLHRGAVAEHSPASAFFAGPRSAAAKAYVAGQLVM